MRRNLTSSTSPHHFIVETQLHSARISETILSCIPRIYAIKRLITTIHRAKQKGHDNFHVKSRIKMSLITILAVQSNGSSSYQLQSSLYQLYSASGPERQMQLIRLDINPPPRHCSHQPFQRPHLRSSRIRLQTCQNRGSNRIHHPQYDPELRQRTINLEIQKEDITTTQFKAHQMREKV